MQQHSETFTTIWHWALFLGVIFAIFAGITYNKLQKLSQNVKEKSSNIQIALTKKIAEINQLLNMLHGYEDFEQFTQLKVSVDSSAVGMTAAYQQSSAMLAAIQGAAQRFPDLKADGQYSRVTASIQNCEVDIQRNRMIYTAAVKEFNTQALAIPAVFVSRLLGFPPAPYLEFDTSGMPDQTNLREFKSDNNQRMNQLLGPASGPGMVIQGGQIGAGSATPNRLASSTGAPQLPAGPQCFYLAPGGVPQGPAAMEQIRGMVLAGQLPLNLLVAQAGTTQWIPINQVTAGQYL
jgi:LemA protein